MSASAAFEHIKDIKLPSSVLGVASSGDTLYASCLDGGVYRVPVDTGAATQIGKHDSYASGVRTIPSLGQIVSAGYDGTLRWFDQSTGKPVRRLNTHSFWSWKMRVSPDQKLVASVTGQYAAGGYKYEPAPEREPSVRVIDAATGAVKWSLAHVPPVLSTAFSPDSRYLAAGNLLGEVRIWDMTTGKLTTTFTTPDFTCWGIIKSHLYIGGIFDLTFSPDGAALLLCGMGPMIDPMAGNGKQTWQRFAWKANPPKKIGEIADADAGHGLMESISYHPSGEAFVMAGKLAQGKWNAAAFDEATGALLASEDLHMRVIDTAWLQNGAQIALAGAVGQERPKGGRCPDFGRIKLYRFKLNSA